MNAKLRALLGGFLGGAFGALAYGFWHNWWLVAGGCFSGSLLGYWNRDIVVEFRWVWPGEWLRKQSEATGVTAMLDWFRLVENRIKCVQGACVVTYFLAWLAFGVGCLVYVQDKPLFVQVGIWVGLFSQVFAVLLAPPAAYLSHTSSQTARSARLQRYTRGPGRFVLFQYAAFFRGQAFVGLCLLAWLVQYTLYGLRLLVLPAVPLLATATFARVLLYFSLRAGHWSCFLSSLAVTAASVWLLGAHFQGANLYLAAVLVGGASGGWAVTIVTLAEESVKLKVWANQQVGIMLAARSQLFRKSLDRTFQGTEIRLEPLVLEA